jgi:hypothetical protein
MRLRPLVFAGALTALAAAALPAVAGGVPGGPVTVQDDDDVSNVLDLRQVTVQENRNGRIRVEIVTWETWSVSELVTASGPSGSVCVKLWTTRQPSSRPPNYLVCAFPDKGGKKLQGQVLRDSGGSVPLKVASASVSGPDSKRRLAIAFTYASIRKPPKVRFAVEAAQASGCPRPRGCIDTAPDAPRSRAFEPRP